MSTLRVDNIRSRTGTAVSITQGNSIIVGGGMTVTGDLNVTGSGNVNTSGIMTAGSFVGGAGGLTGIVSATAYNIGITSAGTSITSNIKTLNFVGTGNTFKVSGNTVDVSISGGAGGASKIYDSTVFAYQNIVESDITIESPYKVATFYTSPDVTIDVEDDVTITVDSGCTLLAIDI